MRRFLTLLFLFAIGRFGLAQDIPIASEEMPPAKLKKNKKNNDTDISIKDYQIISVERDTAHFDTTLTIQKDYKFNYLRRDDFELLPFSNLGQPYNKLGYAMAEGTLFPQIGAKAKHFNYMQAEDISYYRVPTPTTELLFRSAMEQGQLADGFFTANTSERFNFSIANKGLRSLGKYQNIRSSVGNFRLTANYRSKNNRYLLRAHFVSQDIANQENGGITEKEQFESGEDEFTDRSRIDVVFQDAENKLLGKRYYFDQEYTLREYRDSTSYSRLSLEHAFNYETKVYRFEQDDANDFFGASFENSDLLDRIQLRTMYNELTAHYDSKITGKLSFGAISYNYDYFFKSILFTSEGVITNQLKGEEFGLKAAWHKQIKGFALHVDGATNISGDLGGTSLKAALSYDLKDKGFFKAGIYSRSRMPDFNFLLYQSNYQSYNWQNTDSFNKQETAGIFTNFNLFKWFDLQANYSVIDNYTYFAPVSADEGAQISPFQSEGTINYLKVKLTNEFRFGKFALANTFMYQNVTQDQDILNVPQFVTRNTFYFSDHLFKKAMFVQTGFTFKYFTSYYADGYNPLIAEFFSQNSEEIGGFPLIDFFINARVQQTRIYLKAEHFNSSFTGFNFYAAPNNPYRDFIVRFGLVWNFFL
ncbi:putative porin [Ascidiimonas aurantiaca]|uniref:putative porin n=1 Tax=Ascidiimonas aurantiaca TaxID=1685432 RepID=UPI0030EF71F1